MNAISKCKTHAGVKLNIEKNIKRKMKGKVQKQRNLRMHTHDSNTTTFSSLRDTVPSLTQAAARYKILGKRGKDKKISSNKGFGDNAEG